MQPAEIYRLITPQIRRGLIIFPCLWFAAILSFGVLVAFAAGRPWAVCAFFISIFAGLGIAHVSKRNAAARKVSLDPKVVFWAHPSQPLRKGNRDLRNVGKLSNEPIADCTLLTLHLRDGSHFEVNLPVQQMRIFLAWLCEENPSVRLGTYDGGEPVTPVASIA